MKREAPPTLVVVLAVILGSQTSCNLSSRRDGVVGAGSGTTGPTGGDGRVPRAVPISGGTLLVATDGRAWVSDPDRDRVVVADLETGDVEREHELEEGAWPGKAAADGEGNVYVVLRGAGQVQRFDRTGDAQAPFEVCANPRGVAWSAEREALLVACVEGELVVSTAEGAILERLEPSGSRRFEAPS
jgi:streptogramin lyase